MELSKQTLFRLSSLTLFGFSAVGLLIIYYVHSANIRNVIFDGFPWVQQIPIGLFFGTIAAFLGLFLIRAKILEGVSNVFQDLFQNIELDWHDITFYSFCAGLGEEVFFRAAIQPLIGHYDPHIGVWVTAIIFVALHGYLNPKNWKMLVYGIYLVGVSAGLGYLYLYIGLWAAAAAHFVFDLIMFAYLVFYKP